MITDEKNKLVRAINDLLTKKYILDNESAEKSLRDLSEDIENDFYTVVVLGEFKRGKSTLINALLGENLLPSDVLPETATINALIYSQEPKLVVVKNDGSEETGEPTNAYLQRFSASNEEDYVNSIKYIKIGYNADILQKKIVLVDTPGVSDINEQRCEVTYRFIPKANAVLFLLDANSPLKRTEKDFIEEHLTKTGIDNIIFVLNKFDCVDEDEEEDFLNDIKSRLYRVFCLESENKLKNLKVFPLSAKWALQGILKNNSQDVELSGINELKDEIEQLVTTGSVEQGKLRDYKRRLQKTLRTLRAELENKRAIKATDTAELKKIRDELIDTLNELQNNKNNISTYIVSEQKNILKIIDKSLFFFYKRLSEDIEEQILLYKGMDFKDFVEQRISRALQRQLSNWVSAYAPNVDMLLKNMEREIGRGMSYKFQQKISLDAKTGTELQANGFVFDFNVQDVSTATTKAGIVAAGGAGLMMLIGGPLVMPFISMAAFPFLQRKFLEETLARAKDEIIPEVMNQLESDFEQLKSEIHNYVSDRCDLIAKNAEIAYKTVLENVKEDINTQIREKDDNTNNSKEELQNLTVYINEIETIVTNLEGEA